MTDERQPLTPEELQDDGSELPDREAMSILPIDMGVRPVPIDDVVTTDPTGPDGTPGGHEQPVETA